MARQNVAVVGCGNISGIYLQNLTKAFDNTAVYAVADLIPEQAKAKATEFGVERIMTFEEMLADENVDIILNLTTPPVHFDVCRRALLSGKHVYVEKPLSLTFEEGRELTALAGERGLRLGCAPDTFMGSGIQTCRKLIDEGAIGTPVGASAFMVCHGHESWHPNPEFYYKKGGGPLFDMGPYYLTALVTLLGPVAGVSGMTGMGEATRTIGSEPKRGQIIEVEVPTHVNGLLRFENGALGSLIMSFDVWGSTLPRIEIYGTEGALLVPDPNGFGGEVMLKRRRDGEFQKVPPVSAYGGNHRGIGLSDMAAGIADGRPHRASGDLALHVLEIMESLHRSGEERREIPLTTTCSRPEAFFG